MSLLTVVVSFLSFIALSGAYHTGAPSSACSSMTPGHGTTTQANFDTFYSIVTSPSQFSPGDVVQVTLSGLSGKKFRGFLIEMRAGSTPIGTWTVGSDGQTVTCTSANAAVTHATNTDKTSIVMSWTAPSTASANVQVWATVVETQPTWWGPIAGPILTFVPTTTTSTTTTTTTTPTTTTTTTTPPPPTTTTTTTKTTTTTPAAATTTTTTLTPSAATTAASTTTTTMAAAATTTTTTTTTTKTTTSTPKASGSTSTNLASNGSPSAAASSVSQKSLNSNDPINSSGSSAPQPSPTSNAKTMVIDIFIFVTALLIAWQI